MCVCIGGIGGEGGRRGESRGGMGRGRAKRCNQRVNETNFFV